MVSVKRLAAMLRRAWQDRASSRYQLKRLASTRRLFLEALEDRLCPSGGYLLVSSYNTDSVQRYDENTGAYVDTFVPPQSGGLREPMGVLFGPDHNLYVSSGVFSNSNNKNASHGNGQKAVLQYGGTTGAFLSDFADQNQLTSPRGIIFGPDGNLYVADGNGPGTVARYNGATGAFMGDFVPTGSGGLEHPGALVFGPDGALYVASYDLSEVLRYDGKTGAFLGTFVAPGSGGLHIPQMMAFGPDGDLYVASGNFFTGSPTFAPGSVLRYDGKTGPSWAPSSPQAVAASPTRSACSSGRTARTTASSTSTSPARSSPAPLTVSLLPPSRVPARCYATTGRRGPSWAPSSPRTAAGFGSLRS